MWNNFPEWKQVAWLAFIDGGEGQSREQFHNFPDWRQVASLAFIDGGEGQSREQFQREQFRYYREQSKRYQQLVSDERTVPVSDEMPDLVSYDEMPDLVSDSDSQDCEIVD